MNQLEVVAPVRVPPQGTQRYLILMALKQGARLTVAKALNGELHCYALSQRIGELKRDGWPIQSRIIETESGKHIAEYWL